MKLQINCMGVFLKRNIISIRNYVLKLKLIFFSIATMQLQINTVANNVLKMI